jgi:hypothetical protein
MHHLATGWIGPNSGANPGATPGATDAGASVSLGLSRDATAIWKSGREHRHLDSTERDRVGRGATGGNTPERAS